MKLTWFGTAAFRVQIGETLLYLDPYLSRNPQARPVVPLRPEEITRADYIFLSHGHFDHSYDVPMIASQTGARVFAHSAVCDALRNQGVPDEQLRPLQGIETIGLGSFRVRTIPGSHLRFDTPLVLRTLRRGGLSLLRHLGVLRYAIGGVMGYLFTEGEDTSLCFLGSAGYRPELIAGLAPTLAMVPLQGHSEIHRIAAELVSSLRPRWVIPHHHDDFFPPLSQMIDLAPFIAEVQRMAPDTRVQVPVVGNVMRLEKGELIAETNA